MGIKDIWKSSKLRQIWHTLIISKIYARLRRFWKSPNRSLKYLLPNRLWIDTVDVIITTRCNLRCNGCHHLMPYYEAPYHMDKERLIAAMRKLNESFDWCDRYNFLGGEPFLNPDFKYYLEEAPREKCNRIQIITNGTVIPTDPELFDVMRRKKVWVAMSEYPDYQDKQQQFMEQMKREEISCGIHRPEWTDYGEPVNHNPSRRDMRQQFSRCPVKCKKLYS